MVEVNYRCRSCRPFAMEAPCASCLESQLEMVAYRRDVRRSTELDDRAEHEDVLSIFPELESEEAEEMAA